MRSTAPYLQDGSTVLLATDGSSALRPVEDVAIALARAANGRLLVVSALGEIVATGASPERGVARLDQRRAVRERAVEEIVARCRAAGVDVTFLVWSGEPGPIITEAADAERADVVVVGSPRPRLDRRPDGVAAFVRAHSGCPVIEVPLERAPGRGSLRCAG